MNKRINTGASLVCAASLLAMATTATAQVQCIGGNESPGIAATTPTADFVIHNDGTATHTLTGLMWKQCPQGQTWNAGNNACDGTVMQYTWSAALAQGTADTTAGHSDWRVPNVKELASIVEDRCGPNLNVAIFPNTTLSRVWSSSSFASDASKARAIGMFEGGWIAMPKSDLNMVRLVRAAP